MFDCHPLSGHLLIQGKIRLGEERCIRGSTEELLILGSRESSLISCLSFLTTKSSELFLSGGSDEQGAEEV